MRAAGALLALLLVLGAGLPGVVRAADDTAFGRDEVVAYLNQLNSFSAAFRQRRFDETGALLEAASGDASIQRPGRFRWDYHAPYPQTIVSNGETLWIYDPDLEQVTRNAVGDAPASSPAALLGEAVDVATHYRVEAIEPGADSTMQWFEFSAREQGDFNAVRLGFAGGEVRAMRLDDNLGQRTEIEFEDVLSNPVLDGARFEFDVPDGVDVIEGAAPTAP